MEVQKGKKDRPTPLVHSRKLAEHDNFPPLRVNVVRENPDRAENQSDCRIRYRALLEKHKYSYVPFFYWCIFLLVYISDRVACTYGIL